MPARPLLPGNYDSFAAARAAKLGRNLGRKRKKRPKEPRLPPDNPVSPEPFKLTHIPNDPMPPTSAGNEALANRPKSVQRLEALALARAEVKDRLVGPAQETEPEQAKELGMRLLSKLVPRAIQVLHFTVVHGQAREQVVAAMDILDRVGFHKGPVVPLGNGPVIMINVGGPLPWEGKPEIDVTPKKAV